VDHQREVLSAVEILFGVGSGCHLTL